MKAIQQTSFPVQRPLHDLTQRDLYIILSALLTLTMPVGAALIAQAAICLYMIFAHEDDRSDMRRLMRGHYMSADPQIADQLRAYEQGRLAEQAGTLSEADQRQWYQLVGFLTRTSPKPWLPLYEWRLDLILLGVAVFYKLVQLYSLYPAVMDRLFFERF